MAQKSATASASIASKPRTSASRKKKYGGATAVAAHGFGSEKIEVVSMASDKKKGGVGGKESVEIADLEKRRYTVQPREWTDLDVTLDSLRRTLDAKYSDALNFSIALMRMVFPSKSSDVKDYEKHQAALVSSKPLKPSLPTLRKLEVQLASVLLYAMVDLKIENPFHKLPYEGAYKSLVDNMKNPLLQELIVKTTSAKDIKPELRWRYQLLSSHLTDEQRKYRTFLQNLLAYLNKIEQGPISNVDMKSEWHRDMGRISIAMLEAEILAVYAVVTAQMANGTIDSQYIRGGALYMKNFPGVIYQFRDLLTPELTGYLCANCEELDKTKYKVLRKEVVNYRVRAAPTNANASDSESSGEDDDDSD